MDDDALPLEVRRFVVDNLPSVAHLEALLLLRSQPGESVEAASVARALYVDEGTARRALEDLSARRLVARQEGPTRYRYEPVGTELRAAVEAVAKAHRTMLIPLSRFIHEQSRSVDLHAFANAFRLRKD